MAEIHCCVLGATGFIGGQIARSAAGLGWRVRGLRRRPNEVGAVGDLDVEWVLGDLADPASLVSAMRGCPLVFHAAGYYPQQAQDVWETLQHAVTGMRNVLSAASTAGVKRLIYTSAFTTVGPPPAPGQLASERDWYVPGSIRLPLFEVKWAMEMEALRATLQGLPVVSLLPGFVLGPGDPKPTSDALLLLMAQGQIKTYLEGEINVVDGRDVGMGHIAAAGRGKPGQRYILGGHNLALREIQDMVAELTGGKPPGSGLRLPSVASRWTGKYEVPGTHQLRALEHWQPLDSSRARAELGLPDPIPFERTCRDALSWFHQQGLLKSGPVDVEAGAD